MPAEVTYELNLEPIEGATGWTAMIYRSVRAGVCGPWTETKPVPGLENRMFVPVDELAAKAVAVLGLEQEFEPGSVEVYGRYGAIALRVDLVRKEERHMVPVVDDGELSWVDAGPVRHG